MSKREAQSGGRPPCSGETPFKVQAGRTGRRLQATAGLKCDALGPRLFRQPDQGDRASQAKDLGDRQRHILTRPAAPADTASESTHTLPSPRLGTCRGCAPAAPTHRPRHRPRHRHAQDWRAGTMRAARAPRPAAKVDLGSFRSVSVAAAGPRTFLSDQHFAVLHRSSQHG